MEEYKFAIATGHVNPFLSKSRKASKLLTDCPGFYGVHPCESGTLFFYDTLNDAKSARNKGRAEGIQFGMYISKFRMAADGVPEFVEVL